MKKLVKPLHYFQFFMLAEGPNYMDFLDFLQICFLKYRQEKSSKNPLMHLQVFWSDES